MYFGRFFIFSEDLSGYERGVRMMVKEQITCSIFLMAVQLRY